MRILIVGAGGVGGFFGAWLLAAGRDVTFLVRPQRALQLNEHGLQLLSPAGDLTLPPPPTVLASTLAETYDLILLSCKAYDLASAMNDFAPAVGADTAVLPLLNGMAHLETLDQRFGRERVLGGCTNLSASRDEQGRILHLNPLDALQFGDRNGQRPAADKSIFDIARIADCLAVPGYTADLRADILQTMWHKWVTIATAASATCLLRAAIGDVVAAGAAELVPRFLAEAGSIAAAEGYPPSAEHTRVTLAKFTQPGSLFTASMLRDIEAGGQIEGFQIIGDLLAHARRHALATPLLDITYAHLRCYEQRRQRELVARGLVASCSAPGEQGRRPTFV
jgi:2-dehydropantoate 2-reductase